MLKTVLTVKSRVNLKSTFVPTTKDMKTLEMEAARLNLCQDPISKRNLQLEFGRGLPRSIGCPVALLLGDHLPCARCLFDVEQKSEPMQFAPFLDRLIEFSHQFRDHSDLIDAIVSMVALFETPMAQTPSTGMMTSLRWVSLGCKIENVLSSDESFSMPKCAECSASTDPNEPSQVKIEPGGEQIWTENVFCDQETEPSAGQKRKRAPEQEQLVDDVKVKLICPPIQELKQILRKGGYKFLKGVGSMTAKRPCGEIPLTILPSFIHPSISSILS
jgi:hypothetical protein